MISEYVGGGEAALLEKESDERRAQDDKKAAAGLRRRIENEHATNERIDAAFADSNTLVQAILLAGGYHQHSRTWRRRRGR